MTPLAPLKPLLTEQQRNMAVMMQIARGLQYRILDPEEVDRFTDYAHRALRACPELGEVELFAGWAAERENAA